MVFAKVFQTMEAYEKCGLRTCRKARAQYAALLQAIAQEYRALPISVRLTAEVNATFRNKRLHNALNYAYLDCLVLHCKSELKAYVKALRADVQKDLRGAGIGKAESTMLRRMLTRIDKIDFGQLSVKDIANLSN